MEPLLALDDARACDPVIAGHKAAGLARAAAAGMPVLRGWVLPSGVSAVAMSAGCAAGERGSAAAAILAVSSIALDDELRAALGEAVDDLGGSVAVRSSSPLEGDPRWSGAFATYLDVMPDDVGSAVRGCWASAFARDAGGRGERLGVRASEPGVAVLIQPWMRFDAGGVASVDPRGTITIRAASGSPADLVAGRSDASTITVDPDGAICEEGGPAAIARDTIVGVAELMRLVASHLGDDAIEWGVAEGSVSLLQVKRTRRPDVVGTRSAARRRSYPPVAGRLARCAAAYPGSLGERWILPWAFTLEDLPSAVRIDVGDVHRAIADAERLAGELASAAWALSPSGALDEAARSFRAVLGPEPFAELSRLSSLRAADATSAARLLGLIAGIGEALRMRGCLEDARDAWRLSPADLRRAAEGATPAVRAGRDRWEPFLFSVAEDRGRTLVGRPAAPGIGAGTGCVVDPGASTTPPPRRILIASAVVPQLAPWLWEAAGLVAATGSEGAHLFEVARSLGVPAVIGVDVGEAAGRVIAVDGDLGGVAVLDDGRSIVDRGSTVERRTG
jgi:phosphohistidine swiveling domain-containing protein